MKKPKMSDPKLPYMGRVASYLSDQGGGIPSGTLRGGIGAPIMLGGPIVSESNNARRLTPLLNQQAALQKASLLGGVS